MRYIPKSYEQKRERKIAKATARHIYNLGFNNSAVSVNAIIKEAGIDII